MTDAEKNKQAVLAYYNMVWNEKRPAEAVATYVGPEYVQHNPQLADGPEAFVAFASDFAERFPRSSLEIKRAVAEGDLVVLHGLLRTSPDDRGTAAMDILRLVEGRVVEHWDVLQPVPENSANANAMV